MIDITFRKSDIWIANKRSKRFYFIPEKNTWENKNILSFLGWSLTWKK